MAQLREGTKVKTVTGLVGTVEAIYNMGTVVYYIVKIEDGSLYKFFKDQLTEIEEEPEKAPEENKVIPDDNTEVVISFGDFKQLVSEIAIETNPGDLLGGLKFVAFGALLASKLFFGKENV